MSSHEEEIDEVSGSEGQPEEVVKEDAEVEEEEAPLEQPKETFELTRSEKKRDREKKRRKDLNAGYDALMSLIFKIDPKIRQEAEERVKKSKGGVEELPVLNRLELIQSTVHVLERVHQENEERKLVIIHLSRGLLGGGEGGGALPPELPSLSAALRQNPGHSFPNQRDFQQRQEAQRLELQQQLEFEALIASSRGRGAGMPSLGNDPDRFLRQAALGLCPPRRGLPLDPSFAGRNSMVASLMAGSSLPRLYDGRLSLTSDPEAMGCPAEYRERLNRILQEGEESALSALAGLGGVPGRGRGELSSLLSRPMGSPPVRMTEDSIRQAMMREQTMATASKTRSTEETPPESNSYSPEAKRMRQFY